MNEFVVPEGPKGRKRKPRNICKFQEHNWEGDFYDGWIFVDCTKCDAKNIQYQLSQKQLKAISHDWDVNKLYIYVDRAGNHIDKDGNLMWGYAEEQEINKGYYEAVKTSGNFGKPYEDGDEQKTATQI
jgi:hypothetical protein